ncbi:uncharacterized protein SPAPADRAFT_52292 [Spathaspora passalidarum NRRL Y-27907]|uniref:Uncharacterized protein n=1 Tax=Spathaspora passalidarum (strain NRRL Y-27907 / 11-Y1) TaxID=619300 RepID=G3ASQ6_SPAPN|nr:uncharacterized protein SPAPADRAFT_52292 [Spathaspora passalidarum NRRL Y-27907]EGW31120.1 hypothetical protein SPAPADRAFT_52292 [Spathaspora passalidarum NRRL Y-27907]
MSDPILANLDTLPPEIIQLIVDYIPLTSQRSLVDFQLFRKFVLPKLLSDIHVLQGGLSVIRDPFKEYFNPDDPYKLGLKEYTPICGYQEYETIKSEPLYLANSISLIKIVEKYGVFPQSISFEDHLSFFEILQSFPEIIANAKQIYIRMMNLNPISRTSNSWRSILNSVSALPLNITTLELISVPIDNIQFSSTLNELIYQGKIRDCKRVFEWLTNLTRLTLRGVQIQQIDLSSLPDNIEYLNIADLKITQPNLQLPKSLKELIVSTATAELSDLYTSFSLKFPPLEEFRRFEFSCDELTNLTTISLPMCVEELVLRKCRNLFLVESLEKYVNLRTFEWLGALLSPSFYLLSPIPPNLERLIIDGDNAKTSMVINILARAMPSYFYSIYGMYTFRVGTEFKLPESLKELSIRNCQFLEINCESLALPTNLKSITLENLAGFVGYLQELALPSSITYLNFSSMKIDFIDRVVFPASLRKLYLDDNKLRRVSETANLRQLQHLQKVSLTGNSLESNYTVSINLPKTITHIQINDTPVLMEMPFDNMKQLTVPVSVTKSSYLSLNANLEVLVIKNNFEFNEDFRLPANLRILILDEVPNLKISKSEWLENLPENLQEIRISVSKRGSCEISPLLQTVKFPSSLRLLTLQNLNISSETYSKFDFSECTKLSSMQIDNGNVSEIDLNCLPEFLTDLKLQNLKIHNFIGNFARFINLKSLFLSGNKLRKYVTCNNLILPPSIEDLSLMQCNIKTIEISNIQECKVMRQVNLSKNSWMDPVKVANVARELNKVSHEFSCVLVDDVIMDDDLILMQRNSKLTFNFQAEGESLKDYSLIYSCPTGIRCREEEYEETDNSEDEM